MNSTDAMITDVDILGAASSSQPASCPICTPNLASEDGSFKSTLWWRWGSDGLATF